MAASDYLSSISPKVRGSFVALVNIMNKSKDSTKRDLAYKLAEELDTLQTEARIGMYSKKDADYSR